MATLKYYINGEWKLVDAQQISDIQALQDEMGDVETALDTIIAMQKSSIGGDSV